MVVAAASLVGSAVVTRINGTVGKAMMITQIESLRQQGKTLSLQKAKLSDQLNQLTSKQFGFGTIAGAPANAAVDPKQITDLQKQIDDLDKQIETRSNKEKELEVAKSQYEQDELAGTQIAQGANLRQAIQSAYGSSLGGGGQG